jgi:hypothetical protein
MKNNFVAKNAHKFNRANVMVDRKKAAKKSGYKQDQAWHSLGEFEHSIILEYYERSDHAGLHSYLMCVLNLTSSQIYEIKQSLNDGVS